MNINTNKISIVCFQKTFVWYNMVPIGRPNIKVFTIEFYLNQDYGKKDRINIIFKFPNGWNSLTILYLFISVRCAPSNKNYNLVGTRNKRLN